MGRKGKKSIKDFDEVVVNRDCLSICNTEFGPFMDAMGTSHCEEAHIRTIKNLEVDGETYKKYLC